MGEKSPKPASTPTGAVFLSYASQDAEAAQRMCAALRAGGIEVWFDQSELRGGDAWDHKIRNQIRDCRLFIPVISANSESRDEGYFRREWRLAVERVGDMLHKRTFLVPVVIDATPERGAAVPEKFHELQWTRLPRGETPAAFVERIKRLLEPEAPSVTPAGSMGWPIAAAATRRASLPKAALWGVGVIAAAALAYLVAGAPGWLRHSATPAAPAAAAAQRAPAAAGNVAFNPPPHSIAVLPFVNMSGNREQEYFSDGLTEELLNSLAHVSGLRVAARTSAFAFKDQDADIGTIAHKLNVGAVLEGSVRRSAHTVRVTTQLIDATSGYHLWSETYDRDLGDVLKLQAEIATAVAGALKVTLLGDVAKKIEAGGTRQPAAFDAYLRAAKAYHSSRNEPEVRAAIDGYTEAIRLDPGYALAYAARSIAFSNLGGNWSRSGAAVRVSLEKATADARQAAALAADLADGRLALAIVYEASLEFALASAEYERALALAPGNARLLRVYGVFAVRMGNSEPGLQALRRAVELDPLDFHSHLSLGHGLAGLRRYAEALTAYRDAYALYPDDPYITADMGLAYYGLRDLKSARTSCEALAKKLDLAQACMAMTYDKLGRHAEAEAMLTQVRESWGELGAVTYAWVYAQRGDTGRALDWLETAQRVRDPWLVYLKTDPLLDPLRGEPRFQAIERELKFPPS